jgi:type I restriction enzyme S subunit
MSEWKEYKLGEIADIQNGYAFKSVEFAEEGIPIIKIKNIVPPIVVLNEVQFYNGEISQKLKRFLVKKKDFLISMTGSTVNQMASAVGKMSRYQHEFPSLINQRVAKIHSTSELVTDDYLFYYLNRYEVQYDLALSASGSANQANISPEQLKSYKISLPDIPTQTAIAEILSSLDDKIELNNKINQELEDLAQTLFKRWFIDFEFPNENGEPYKSSGGEMVESELGEIPKGWEVGKFEKLVKISTGKGINRKDYKERGKYAVIGANGIMGYYSNYNIDRFKILTGRVGTLGTVRISNEKVWTSDNVLICEPLNKESNHYSYFVMKDFDFTALNRGSTQPLITQTDLKSQTILIPENNILTLFQNQMDYFLSILEENKTENIQLTNLRDTLLPKLISGELTLNEISNQ